MSKRIAIGAALAALSLGAASAATAQPGPASALASVDAVQSPAWVDRAGIRYPLAPGAQLKASDQVRTGAGSRLLLRTADGSTVKLGENASLVIESMRMRGENFLEAALKVAVGAFRFTTEALAKTRGRREVSITVATVTAGIRGTDLWGKSSPDRQIVCLIEGEIEVTAPGESPRRLGQPMSYYTRENGVSQPIATVPADQLREWSAETEPQPGEGLATQTGRWKVLVKGLAFGQALEVYEELRNAGYAAEIIPAEIGNKRVYDVHLSKFATKQDAEFAANALKRQGRLARYQTKVGT